MARKTPGRRYIAHAAERQARPGPPKPLHQFPTLLTGRRTEGKVGGEKNAARDGGRLCPDTPERKRGPGLGNRFSVAAQRVVRPSFTPGGVGRVPGRGVKWNSGGVWVGE